MKIKKECGRWWDKCGEGEKHFSFEEFSGWNVYVEFYADFGEKFWTSLDFL